ncbi:hypothetical protein OIU78_004361 [Salix suchowensis]|nr:hypothetical protein OIU78_004361 [Salix suchowensis]
MEGDTSSHFWGEVLPSKHGKIAFHSSKVVFLAPYRVSSQPYLIKSVNLKQDDSAEAPYQPVKGSFLGLLPPKLDASEQIM